MCLDSFPNEPYFAAAHPIKLLEYGACGKPVVATNVEETAKIISNGIHGYLSNPDNPDMYGEYIIKLLLNPQLSLKMGKELQNFVTNNFDWDIISQKIETNCF